MSLFVQPREKKKEKKRQNWFYAKMKREKAS